MGSPRCWAAVAELASGKFITLEGGEGAGKSTLSRGLAAALQARGVDVVLTREPGGTPGADEIRELLVKGETGRWGLKTEALLFSAARLDHLERRIRPALAAGQWVICDRYYDSTYAYQVAARGLDPAFFDALVALVGFDTPDLTLILDLPPEMGLKRSRGATVQEDRYERMDLAFHTRVRAGFAARAAAAPARFVTIDATGQKAATLAAALNAIDTRLT
jgi:dTMP kinase